MRALLALSGRPLCLSFLVLSSMLIGGCGYLPADQSSAPDREASQSSASANNLQSRNTKAAVCDQQWLLESLRVNGREHRSRMFWRKMWRDRPHFSCDKLGFVRGSAGTNPYLGKFSLSESGSIKWLKPPKISLLGDRKNSAELERDYLLALPLTDSASVSGDVLILRSLAGDTQLEFKRVERGSQPD